MTEAEKERQHTVGGLSERQLSVALLAKYIALTLYGIWAAIVEIPTMAIVGSPRFAITWAILVAVFAAIAAFGVMRTWTTLRSRVERVATASFIITFMSYSTALVVRAIQSGDWSPAPLSLIPLAVCVLPTIRFYSLGGRSWKGGRS